MPSNKISYSRGFPHGAPLVMLRGGAINNPNVRAWLKSRGFRWDGKPVHAYTHYMYGDDLREVLEHLRDFFGCDIVPKKDLDPNYIINLTPEGD